MNFKYITKFEVINPLGEVLNLSDIEKHSLELDKYDKYRYDSNINTDSTFNKIYAYSPLALAETYFDFTVDCKRRKYLDDVKLFLLREYFEDEVTEFTIRLTFRDDAIDIVREFKCYIITAEYNRLGETTEEYVATFTVLRNVHYYENITLDFSLNLLGTLEVFNSLTFDFVFNDDAGLTSFTVDKLNVPLGEVTLNFNDLEMISPMEITMLGILNNPAYIINGFKSGVEVASSNGTLIISSFPGEERVELNGENVYQFTFNTEEYSFGNYVFPNVKYGENTFEFEGCEKVRVKIRKYMKLP